MERLAERTERLLKHVQDWPLGGAVDYLVEHGFGRLWGVDVLRRDRVARLKLRLRAVATDIAGGGLQEFAVRKYWDGPRVFWWWLRDASPHADGLSVGLLPGRDQVGVARVWREMCNYSLPEWCQANAGEFPERCLCDLFVLLWTIARCYAGD